MDRSANVASVGCSCELVGSRKHPIRAMSLRVIYAKASVDGL